MLSETNSLIAGRPLVKPKNTIDNLVKPPINSDNPSLKPSHIDLFNGVTSPVEFFNLIIFCISSSICIAFF